MKKTFAAICLAFVPLVASAATSTTAEAQDATEVQFEIPPPPEGKGQVVFYRPTGGVGVLLGCAVFDVESPEKLSSLGSGRYFVLVSDPGPRSFTVKSLETKDALSLEIEPDETQYVRCRMRPGLLSARADISPSSESEFREKYKNPKLVDPDDMSESVRDANY